jgi:enoyl-CoA hydratase
MMTGGLLPSAPAKCRILFGPGSDFHPLTFRRALASPLTASVSMPPSGLDRRGFLPGNWEFSQSRYEDLMQMLNPHCGIDRDSRGVARLTICKAGPLNILGSPAIQAVRAGLETLASDRQIRVLILAGESPKSMIGGADIKEMAALDQKSAENFITGLRDLCEAVRNFPAPVIARMPGWCLGGGLEVAAACDFRVAGNDAKFGMPEVRVGIPSVIHAALLPRLIGWGRARWLMMTAENIDAATALAWGLIDVAAPEGGLDAAVEKTVEALLKCGPEALRAQKALLRQWEELPLTESVKVSIGAFGRSFLTDEPKRLMQEFMDRKR